MADYTVKITNRGGETVEEMWTLSQLQNQLATTVPRSVVIETEGEQIDATLKDDAD